MCEAGAKEANKYLKPCPHCGDKVKMRDMSHGSIYDLDGNWIQYRISHNCSGLGKPIAMDHHDLSEAVKSWNDYHDEPYPPDVMQRPRFPFLSNNYV